jgi:hypothetical protein
MVIFGTGRGVSTYDTPYADCSEAFSFVEMSTLHNIHRCIRWKPAGVLVCVVYPVFLLQRPPLELPPDQLSKRPAASPELPTALAQMSARLIE